LKKVVIFILCAALSCAIFAGCGNQPAEESAADTQSTESASAGSAQDDEANADGTAEPEPYVLDAEERLGQFVYGISSSFRAEEDTDSTRYYISDNNSDGLFQVSYYDIDFDDLSDDAALLAYKEEFIAGIEGNESASNLTSDLDVEIENLPAMKFEYDYDIDGENYRTVGVGIFVDDGFYVFSTFEPDSGERRLTATFPSIKESIYEYVPENDFIKNEEVRTQLYTLSNDFKFDEIIALADAYIAKNSPAESDTVYAIKQAAEEANAVIPNCTIVTDEFEDDVVLYGGVDSISSSVNFVPYVGGGHHVYDVPATVGFKQDDWLFFENIKIKVADDEYISDSFDYFDVVRDVINGGTILEEADTSFDLEDAEMILNAEAPIIRFTGEDDKTRDHEMTSEELDSLQNVYIIAKSTNTISETISQWVEENA